MAGEDLRHRLQAGDPAGRVGEAERAPVAVGRRSPIRGEQQGTVRRVEEIDATHRHRPEGVAVVAVVEREERGPALDAPVLPVPERHLEGDLHRAGPGLAVEDLVQAGWGERHQLRGQLDRGHARQAQQRRVGHPAELPDDGFVDLRDRVAVDVDPQRRDAVEVAAPVGVDEPAPLGPLDDQRLRGQPSLHLGERMPDVGLVQGDELLAVVPGHRLNLAAEGEKRLKSGPPPFLQSWSAP